MSMQFETLLVDKMDGVAVVTLNRPDKLNAVSLEMRLEFLDLLDNLTLDDEVMVVIVTGAGRAFCAHEIKIYVNTASKANAMPSFLPLFVRFIYFNSSFVFFQISSNIFSVSLPVNVFCWLG